MLFTIRDGAAARLLRILFLRCRARASAMRARTAPFVDIFARTRMLPRCYSMPLLMIADAITLRHAAYEPAVYLMIRH